MRGRFLVIVLFCTLLFSSCTQTEKLIGPKLEVTQYSTETFNIEKKLDLSITNDSGNLDIYTWNRKEVKFEITKKVRGTQKKDILDKKLKDFDFILNQANNKVILISKYKGDIKNPIDRSVDLRVYVPQKNSDIYCKMDLGKIKILDTIKCNLNIDMNLVDTEINIFEGKLVLKGDMGDLRLNGGELLPGSMVKVNNGSIVIKAVIESQGQYDFETGIGNVDLTLPKESKISLEKIGTIGVNQFKTDKSGAKVKACTDMGKISLKKY